MLRDAVCRALTNICAGRLRYLVESDGTAPKKVVEPPPGKGYPPHAHHCAELVQAVAGTAVLNLGRRVVPLTQKTAWLILPGTVHFETFAAARRPYRLLWTVVGPAGLNLFVSTYRPGGGFGVPPDRLIGVTDNQARLWELTTRAEIQGLLIQTLIGAVRRLDQPAAPTDPRRALVEQIRTYLEHHFREDLTLTDLAQMARCTPNYLNNLFRKYTGQPIHQFVLHRRLDAARTMLAKGTWAVKEVAYTLGFRDPLYFSRLFRRRFRCAPSAVRGSWK
jgi:AraC-like DNA-binding protein